MYFLLLGEGSVTNISGWGNKRSQIYYYTVWFSLLSVN